MKLGELRVAIRAAKGNPMMQVTLPGSAQPIKLGIMKMILLDQLELAFPVSKMQETGLSFDEASMMLSFEGAAAPTPSAPINPGDLDEVMEPHPTPDDEDSMADERSLSGDDLDDLF